MSLNAHAVYEKMTRNVEQIDITETYVNVGIIINVMY